MQSAFAEFAVSVSELKKDPLAVLSSVHASAVAILNHNRVMAYMVPADVFEVMMERLDDLDLAELVRARGNETPVPVELINL